MKLKIILGVIGVILIGSAIYYSCKRKKEREKINAGTIQREVNNIMNDIEIHKTDDYKKLKDDKLKAAGQIKKRHEGAEKIMKESVDTICDDSLVGQSQRNRIKEKILNDLDNM